jgi:hypothetical protein
MRRLWPMLLVAGCYQPHARPGAPCSVDDDCPSGQRCLATQCEPPGTALADAPAAERDAAIPIDAPTWGTPVRVRGVNSSSAEDDPSCTADRLTIVFVSNRNGGNDLFLGTRSSLAASFVVAPLDALNTATTDESSPEITADGSTIYFTSDRVTAGSGDVYVSHRTGPGWSAPALVPELSSAQDDGDLAVSPDELTAIVARGGKLWLATRATAGEPWGTPAAVPSLAVPGNDAAAPSITNHADAVYFHAGAVRDLYYATRAGAGFTTPVPITELDTAARDDAPFVSADEHLLLFARGGDLFETAR